MTDIEKQNLEKSMEQASNSQLQAYRGNIVLLNGMYRKEAFRKDATNTTIHGSIRTTKMDMETTRNSVTNVNKIAKKAQAEGKLQGQAILDKFNKRNYGEEIIEDASLANPFTSFQAYDEFEKSKPSSILEAERQIRSEDEQAYVAARTGTEEPARGSTPFGYADNFKDKEAVMALLKTCIPCEFRSLKLSAEFGLPWENTLNDLKKKWKDLLKLLKDLLSFQAGEFGKDICNLFKFLDGQCIPDIMGLLSLLSMMQLKYMDFSLGSLDNILNQLIAPFLSPIIGSFTSNLDQYADLILGPLKCVTRALEMQIVEIQTQINGANSIADANTVKYRKQEIAFVEAKAKALRNRQRAINKQISTGENEISSNGTVAKRIVSTNFVNGGINLTPGSKLDNIDLTKVTDDSPIALLERDSIFLPLENEYENIAKELQALQREKSRLTEEIKKVGPYSPTVDFSSATKLTTQSRVALDNMSRAYTSILQDLVDAVNDGVGIVKQSIDIYRDEFQRILLGRISTQADQAEFTRMLQKIMRLTSIVNAVMEFKKAGFSLKKFCEQGDEAALAQVAKQIKANDSQGMYDFYSATDSEGNPLMVITTGGAKVSVTGIDFDAIGDDALIGDATVTLDSIKKTVSFNDLNEVDKLNREGIVPSLGNIDSKIIELDNGFKAGSELDLHFKTSYAIISNEFCSKSAISYGSSDTVKKWAETLWQEK